VQNLEAAGRPEDNVTSVPASIDVRPELAGAALHLIVGGEQEMLAAASRGVGARELAGDADCAPAIAAHPHAASRGR
jgi:hypothetical protein